MARSTFVYVTYIRTTPEKLWSALTDVEYMKQYWFGVHCESQWTPGKNTTKKQKKKKQKKWWVGWGSNPRPTP